MRTHLRASRAVSGCSQITPARSMSSRRRGLRLPQECFPTNPVRVLSVRIQVLADLVLIGRLPGSVVVHTPYFLVLTAKLLEFVKVGRQQERPAEVILPRVGLRPDGAQPDTRIGAG